jgi:predicted MFS family arabinose efflux permease
MSREQPPSAAVVEWSRHWTVVLAAAAGSFATSLSVYVLGLFMQPLQDSFGWSRASISAAVTIHACLGFLGAAPAGYMLDRIGTRRVGICGVASFCLFFASLSLVTNSIWTWWGMWVLLGLAGLAMKPAVWAKAVTSFFVESRGMAIAVMLCGTALGSVALPLAANMLITSYGWRVAFAGIGVGVGAIVLPILLSFLLDATNKVAGKPREIASRLPGWTLREGLRKRQLYQIALAALLAVGVIVGFTVHMVPILTAKGLSRSTAVSLLSVVGISSVIARLAVGYVFDRFQHPAIGAVSLGAPALTATILLLLPPTATNAMFAAITLGFCAGAEFDALIYLSSRFFGLKAFGTLFGIVETAMFAGIAMGPIMAGAIFDGTGSYQPFLVAAIPLSLLGSFLVLLLGSYPVHTRPEHTRSGIESLKNDDAPPGNQASGRTDVDQARE